MGCYQSKLENEEAVARCKDRHYSMKQAVSSRNAFAAAHSSYATCLKNAGGALTDFAQAEVQNIQFSPSSSSAVAQLSYDVPLPPPPFPDFPSSLRRAITMPEIQLTRPESDPVETIAEEDEEEGGPGTSFNIDEEGKEEEKVEVERRRSNKERKACKQSVSVNLIQVLNEVDNHFIMAWEAAREVSKMLQATRLHSHSNFDDTTGYLDYSERVMRVVTWDRSFRETDDVKDDFDSEEHETLATVLEKLLAWEKKLYNQVKAAKLTKSEYQRKVATINKLKKSTNSEALEKAKASLSHLHSMYIVDMQLLDSTVSEINQLRDQQLHPKLVQLVDGMATMWGDMQVHHEQQFCIATLLGSLDSQFPTETSEHHHDRTYQLLAVVQEWQSQFEKLINNQKGYIKALNSWLKLSLIPIESDIKENISSPLIVKSPRIQSLLHSWYDHLEILPDEFARTAIAKFAAIIDTIFQQQEEELVLRRKCEEIRKEFTRKSRQFEQWEYKYKQKKRLNEFDPNSAEDDNDPEVVREKRVLVELEKRLDEEKDTYERQCIQVRQKSFECLKNHLPDLFRAMTDFSLECSKMYSELRSLSQRLNSGQSSS